MSDIVTEAKAGRFSEKLVRSMTGDKTAEAVPCLLSEP